LVEADTYFGIWIIIQRTHIQYIGATRQLQGQRSYRIDTTNLGFQSPVFDSNVNVARQTEDDGRYNDTS
jgi:hypothetical protein